MIAGRLQNIKNNLEMIDVDYVLEKITHSSSVILDVYENHRIVFYDADTYEWISTDIGSFREGEILMPDHFRINIKKDLLSTFYLESFQVLKFKIKKYGQNILYFAWGDETLIWAYSKESLERVIRSKQYIEDESAVI